MRSNTGPGTGHGMPTRSSGEWPSMRRTLSFPRMLTEIGVAVVAAGVHVVTVAYESLVYQFDRHREY